MRAGVFCCCVVSIASWLHGCGGERGAEGPGEPIVRTDSSGVLLSEVHWEAAPERWRVDPEPEFSLGDGTPPQDALVLYDIRDAVTLEDGAVVIAEGSTEEVLHVDPTSGTIERWGGRGEGPEEFGTPPGPFPTPAVLGVFDVGRGAIGVFDAARREYVEIDLNQGFRERTALSDVLPTGVDRIFVGPSDELYVLTSSAEPPLEEQGVRRARMELMRVARASPPEAQPVAEVLGAQAVSRQGYMGLLAFGVTTELAAAEEGVWIGDTGTPEVRLREPGNGVTQVVRWTSSRNRQITDDRLEMTMRSLVGTGTIEQRAELDDLVASMPMAERLPAFESLLVDRSGRLWIGEYTAWLADRLERPQPPQEWLVLDLGVGEAFRVTTPAGLRVLRVGDGFVLGIHRDANGVESVRRYRLLEARAGDPAVPDSS